MPKAIGIDLGTTYSCVGVWVNDRVEIIANDHGTRTTASYVAFASKPEVSVGDAAKYQASMNPKNTVFSAKRLIGRRVSDNSAQADMQRCLLERIELTRKLIQQSPTDGSSFFVN